MQELTELLPKVFPSPKLSASIYTVKLSEFIDALIDNDRTVMTAEEFEKVYNQYCDELITEKDRYRLRLILEIKNFQYKTQYVQAAITYLKHDYNQTIAKGLMTIGATETMMPTDPDKIEGWFKRLIGRLKKWSALMQAKQEELLSAKPKEEKEAQVTRSHFDEMLIELSSMLKFQIDDAKITVSRYIVAVKRYRKLVENSKK